MIAWPTLLLLLLLCGCVPEKPQERRIVAPPAVTILPEEDRPHQAAVQLDKLTPPQPFDYYATVNDRLNRVEGQIGWMKERLPR